MQVVVIPALSDNYIYVLLDEFEPQTAAVVDPGAAAPVLEYMVQAGRRLTAILNTHHHRDHTGGNAELLRHFPGIPVYGGAEDRGRIPGQTVFLRGGDEVAAGGVAAKVLDIPGHTRAHIGYWFSSETGHDLFSGDAVFGATIGNLFEGTPDAMFRSMQNIRALPPRTRIWCSHEYTLRCVRESAAVDAHNPRLAARLRTLEATAGMGRPTVPLLLEEECLTSPFFRWDDPGLSRLLGTPPGLPTFKRLCEI
ncbi:MAG: hydroxyacylglutathione hydrolase [Acidobacteriota bacterium]|jgi:hydroxyacylglutathione hydrolase|nr:hydroxyacylglutathione hydrolase [Acidobacteriota bacterium]